MRDPTGPYRRTKKSIRNSIVSLSLQLLSILTGFFSRRIFIDYLGTEIVGLNTTAASILNFLNLAELGIGTAIAVTLYRPLAEKDNQSIREIVALQGRMYRIIASLVLAGSLVVMGFFPQIFGKSELPLWYPYATFSVFLYGSLLNYFFTFSKNVLYADQQNYKIVSRSRLLGILKLVLQALAVRFLGNGYIWWLVLEAVFATLTTFWVIRIVHQEYPFLKEPVARPDLLRKKYPDVLRKVKYLSFHKLGYFAMNQLSPLIIYAFSSLTTVALYGNYMLLTVNLLNLLTALYTGMDAGVGNMVAEGDKKLILKVFRELFTSRFFLVGTCCICLWLLTDSFITAWLGSDYLLGRTTLALIIASFFITNTRTTVDTYLTAYGMFQDIWAPILEGILNVGFSVLLGKIYGLNGILTGVLIAQVAIGFIWKPIFLFSKGLHTPLIFYVRMYGKHLAFLLISFAAMILLSSRTGLGEAASIWAFLWQGTFLLAATVAVFGGLLLLFEQSMRGFLKRVRSAMMN